ncbi:MAG: SRPBCC family protein [Pseudomonadota bacterium]
MTSKSKANEIHLARVYDAPLKAVWDAWTEPEQVAQWWGPRGFTLTHHSKELRPGGIWHYTMHGPDGTDYENKTLYLEVEKHAKLVYDHGGNDERAPLFRVTALFSELGGKTHFDLTMSLASAEAAEEARRFVKRAGGDATWDRLGEYLGERLQNKNLFLIDRSFAAPLEQMFELWSEPKHFSKWLPPTGFVMEFLRADIRTGGASVYRMSNGSGVTMYGRANYLEVRRPDRLVYTQQFCDEHENLSRHPLTPTWPATMLTTVTLTAEGPAQTRVSIRWEPFGEVSAEEAATFLAARAGMTVGWTGSFDKLEALLGAA